MRRLIKGFGEPPQLLFGRDPSLGGVAPQVKRTGGKFFERFFAVSPPKIFIKIGERQFPHGFIHGVTEAQNGMVCFADSAPVTSFLKERYHVVLVPVGGPQIKKKRRTSVVRKCGGREQCSFYTLDFFLPQ